MRRAFIFMVIALISSIMALAVVEFLLRTFHPITVYRLSLKGFQITNDETIYEPSSNPDDFYKNGIRDTRTYSLKKPDNTFRIEVVGDSLAYGLGLNDRDTFSKKLEKKLNENNAGTKQYEIMNFGVPGYRISQIIAHLRKRGLQYNPDMIIYYYWFDDIYISDPGWASAINNPLLKIDQYISDIRDSNNHNPIILLIAQLFDLQISRHIVEYLRNYTINRVTKESQKNSIQDRPVQKIQDLFSDYTNEFREGKFRDITGFENYDESYSKYDNFLYWNHYLKEFSEICKSGKITCIMLLTPVLYSYKQGDYNWSRLHMYVRDVVNEYNIPVIDLTEKFQKYDGGILHVFPNDPEHPNALGNQIITDSLYPLIASASAGN